ncbi:MAG: IS1380 family transposase [Bacteroidota bacterium]
MLGDNLPELAPQSKYNWRDIIYGLYSIYFCGGDCIEDLGGNFKQCLLNNPLMNVSSPDRVLARLKELTETSFFDKSDRGKNYHQFSTNDMLANLNLKVLESLKVFEEEQWVIDYDNTIIFTEKADSNMTYKRDYGYQPGVATLNEKHILYLENRNGNCGANTMQDRTLSRLINLISDKLDEKIVKFRADSASYQFDVIRLIMKHNMTFYIAAKTTNLLTAIQKIETWKTSTDKMGDIVYIAEMQHTPFKHHISRTQYNNPDYQYRFVIKKKARPDGQINAFTQDAFDYTAIVTNDNTSSIEQTIDFYDKRGRMENQFDILKNDFGWNKMPFSKLVQNTVYLFLMAICRNLYNNIITAFSKSNKSLEANFRLKKFIFRFISIPAKWIRSARQNVLKLFCVPHHHI